MREIILKTLSNEISVVFNPITTSEIVHCGIMLDIGSRDESVENQGIAHFWEHMAFKGTRKRKAFHIINRLESLGGELNAFTDKEKIFFFASIRKEYFERAIELLADITFSSVFPENQLDRERSVILEEMAMYYDDPEGSLQDEFDRLVFGDHPMGMNILGTEKTVKSFQRKDFRNFINDHLNTSRVAFSCVGNLPPEKVLGLAEKHLGHYPKKTAIRKREEFSGYKPGRVVLNRLVKQARCSMGCTTFSLADERRSTLFLLTNILGGPGLNSRLNLALREKYGFVYSIGAQYVPFTDTGLLVISFGTDPGQVSRSFQLVNRELDRMKDKPLGKKQLSTAKEQILGQMAMAEENNPGFMMIMARMLLDLGRIPPLEELFAKIKDTSAGDLQNMAQMVFDLERFSSLVMQPGKIK